MTERNLGTLTNPDAVLDTPVPEEATADHLRTTTFDSPKTAAEQCGLILGDIRSVGEGARMAMEAGYAEAQRQKIDLGAYEARMQTIYDDAKKSIDVIIAQLAAIQANISSTENTLPAEDKARIIRVIETGVAQAGRSKEEIVNQLEQQRVRRPFPEEILHNLGETREAYGIAAAAGTLEVGETNPEHIAQSVKVATRSVRENKRVPLAEGVDNRAVQYEDAELQARALGLTQLLDERLANVDGILAAQAGMHGRGLETMAQMRRAYETLESYKLIANDDWRDPAKSGLAARFLGNIDGRVGVKLLLAAGAFGAVGVLGAGVGGVVASGLAVTRTIASGVLGYFGGEKVARGRAERKAMAEGNADRPVPDNLDRKAVNDAALIDMIARIEYKALIAGKSLARSQGEMDQERVIRSNQPAPNPTGSTNPFDLSTRTPRPESAPTGTEASDPNAVIIDADYKRLIEELQRRSEMDKEGARSYSTSLETKLRQADARLRELLKDREKVERAAKIGGIAGAAAALLLPSLFRGTAEAFGIFGAGGPDGSFAHGAVAAVAGKEGADYAMGTGAYSPDALAAAAAANAPTPPATVGAVPPAPATTILSTEVSAPSVSSVLYGPDTPPMVNGQIAYGPYAPQPEASAVAQAAAVNAAPDAGSFVPDKTEFAHYIVGKGEGVSWPLKAQLIEHADKYGWDGTGDKTKWATKKMFELMKSEEFTIDGKSMAIYNADIDKQLWVDQPDRYSFILKYDGKGGYSMDVYDMKAPGGPALLSGNYDQALSEHTISEPQGSGGGSAAQGAGHGAPGQHGPGVPAAPATPGTPPPAPGVPAPAGPPADLAPNAHNKVQWYDQAGFKSEGNYKDAIFGQVYGKAGVNEAWAFGAADPTEIAQNLKVSHTLILEKATSGGLEFSDSFKSVRDMSGSVSDSIKEKFFHPGHPAFSGKFGRLADDYTQLLQGKYVLDHATPKSLSEAGITSTDIANMKAAIAKELEKTVKKLLEFEGALNEDVRPARVFGRN